MQKTKESQADAGKRTFTKRLVSGSVAASWCSIWLGIYAGHAAAVVPPMCGLIVGLIGVYSGTGHLDYRAFINGRTRSPDQ